MVALWCMALLVCLLGCGSVNREEVVCARPVRRVSRQVVMVMSCCVLLGLSVMLKVYSSAG